LILKKLEIGKGKMEIGEREEGYTPVVFVKSAQRIEKRRDEVPRAARE
jgi:hypothetical protein